MGVPRSEVPKRQGGRRTSVPRLSRRRLLQAALGAGAATALGRLGKVPARASAAASGGELFYGLTNRFDTLDPNVTTFTDVGRIAYHIFDPLIWETKAGVFVPGLAERWEVSPAADQYTFHLRRGVRFHDGTPFDADAVKFTFDRVVDPALKSQSAFSMIGPYAATTVVDPYTVVVKFKEPYAPFLSSVAQSVLAPVSPAAVKKYGKDFGTHPVGTGPFRFDSYTTDSVVRLVRNPDYRWAPSMFGHQGPSHLDAISFKIIPEASTRLAALRSGEVQVIQDVPTQDYRNLQHDGTVQLLQGELAGSGWTMMINVTRTPTDDVRLRQALQWGVDKTAMIKAVWQGVYKPASSVITSATFGFDPATRGVYTYDAKKAGALLDEAGWKMGPGGVRQKAGADLVLGLYYRADNTDFTAMATFLQSMYAQIGVKIDLHGLSAAGYFGAVRQGQHHLQFWWETDPDPDVVRILLYSKNADGGTNRNRYKNAEMDMLIDQAAATTNPIRRKQLYAQIQMKTLRESIMVAFSDPLNIFAARKGRVSGVRLDWSATNVLLYDAALTT
ncbi:MAG TPA: ABC transporter substrate-binding protein [bacterium]|nr:ABC transporter substrate-binding protein [bacterium]